jgi:hypothetical protein
MTAPNHWRQWWFSPYENPRYREQLPMEDADMRAPLAPATSHLPRRICHVAPAN